MSFVTCYRSANVEQGFSCSKKSIKSHASGVFVFDVQVTALASLQSCLPLNLVILLQQLWTNLCGKCKDHKQVFCNWCHLFSAYAQRGRGPSKIVRYANKGGEGRHNKVYTQESIFLQYFVIFIFMWKLLCSYFGDNFHYCFIKNLLWLSFCLSNALQSLSSWNYWLGIKNISVRNERG